MPLGEFLRQVIDGESEDRRLARDRVSYTYRFLIMDINRRDGLEASSTKQERDARTLDVAQRALNLAAEVKSHYSVPEDIIVDDYSTSGTFSFNFGTKEVTKKTLTSSPQVVNRLDWAENSQWVIDFAMALLPVDLRDVLHDTFPLNKPQTT
jgi:hypothetical protein